MDAADLIAAVVVGLLMLALLACGILLLDHLEARAKERARRLADEVRRAEADKERER